MEDIRQVGLIAVPSLVSLLVPRLLGLARPSGIAAFVAGAGFWSLVWVAVWLDVSGPQVASLGYQTLAMALVLGTTGLAPPRSAVVVGLVNVAVFAGLEALAGQPDPIELVRALT